MADYKVHIPFLEKWEGGWSNDPDDSGGATMMGITIPVSYTHLGLNTSLLHLLML